MNREVTHKLLSEIYDEIVDARSWEGARLNSNRHSPKYKKLTKILDELSPILWPEVHMAFKLDAERNKKA